MKRYCFALDLIDDPELIREYEYWHSNVWPEIRQSIVGSGIIDMQIYRISDRLFMIMDTGETFSSEQKAAMDAANGKVQEWETMMWKYQKKLPWAVPGEKWMLMHKIFQL